MSKRSSPAAGGSSRRRGSYSDPRLRVSDAERADVADQLSRHYGEGRLSQAEFDERLDQAMRATTRADLSGLTDDLPGTDAAGVPRGRPGRGRHRILAPLLVIAIIITAGPALAWPGHLLPWLLLGLLVFLWLRHVRRRHGQLP